MGGEITQHIDLPCNELSCILCVYGSLSSLHLLKLARLHERREAATIISRATDLPVLSFRSLLESNLFIFFTIFCPLKIHVTERPGASLVYDSIADNAN